MMDKIFVNFGQGTIMDEKIEFRLLTSAMHEIFWILDSGPIVDEVFWILSILDEKVGLLDKL